MRPKWAFQLLPNTPDILVKGFRVDPITQALEDEVNAVLQRRFNFHGISKLVIRLGPGQEERDYHEHIGVAQKHYPRINLHEYLSLTDDQKRSTMRGIVLDVFSWLTSNFADAQCFEKAKVDLNWPEKALGLCEPSKEKADA